MLKILSFKPRFIPRRRRVSSLCSRELFQTIIVLPWMPGCLVRRSNVSVDPFPDSLLFLLISTRCLHSTCIISIFLRHLTGIFAQPSGCKTAYLRRAKRLIGDLNECYKVRASILDCTVYTGRAYQEWIQMNRDMRLKSSSSESRS